MVKKATSLVNPEEPLSEGKDLPEEESEQPNPLDKSMILYPVQQRTKRIEKAAPNKNRETQKRGNQKNKMPMECYRHSNRRVQFICLSRACWKELCSFCILEHKEHVNDIRPLEDVVRENSDAMAHFREKDAQDKILRNQEKSLKLIDQFAQKMQDLIFEKVGSFKGYLINQDDSIGNSIDHILRFKSFFREVDEIDSSLASEESLGLIRKSILESDTYKTNAFSIEEDIIVRQFEKLLDNSIQMVVDGNSLNSTKEGVPKYLHWFEWEKRELHLFDITENCFQTIKLVTTFKTAAFSRSIILPEGQILLIGGQDTNFGAKKDVYCFDVTRPRTELHCSILESMPFKKYDFSLCYHDGFVYVICGKDSDTLVVNTCERYDVRNNSWSLMSSVNKKRYAASASVVKETGRIYLFGGRTDYNTQMVSEVEEYWIDKNEWRLLRLSNQEEWIPVEVCSSIQIGEDKILVFGGSDLQIEDSKNSYVFTPSNLRITKTGPLKKPQVFVNSPFVNGNYVYAPGNEYYVKSRNIHRFNIKTMVWDIVK